MDFDPDDPLRLDHQICFPLYAASNLMTRLYRPLLATLGLTYPQYLVMLVLWETSPAQMSALGRRLHLDSGTLTPLLKRLAAEGLVTRRRDPKDERRLLIALTPAGAALKARARRVPLALAAKFGAAPEDLLRLREAVGETARQLALKLEAEA
jgi:DNA-binding MarR family transcriptional regulator